MRCNVMRIVKASQDDHLGIKDTKDNFFKIYEKLISEGQASNPDTVHDILLNPEAPPTENQLEGQRYTQQTNVSPNRTPYSPDPNNTKNRNFDAQVGQPNDSGMNRTKPGEVGQIGPQEVPVPFKGDAVNNQYEEIGGATNNADMIGEQDKHPDLSSNYMKDSLGPDSASTIEKQLNGDKVIGTPPRVTNNGKWKEKPVVGPPISRHKKTRK